MSQTLLEMLEDDIAIAQDEEFATEEIPCPAVEAPGTITRVRRSVFTSGENTYHALAITYLLDSEEAREVTRRDKVYVDQMFFLNLDLEASKNMEAEDADQQLWVIEKSSNPEFGRWLKWLKSAGYEMPVGWARFWTQLSDDIIGKEGLVKVKQSPRKSKTEVDEDGEPVVIVRAMVSAVATI